jgi:methylglutaconyl-CoA hydratase
MSSPVKIKRLEHVSVLTLDSPPANAFSRAMVSALEGSLEALADEDDVRALIITGAGDRAFCAGADLKERSAMTAAEVRAFVPKLQALTDMIAALPMPTIAAINGAAFGGGCEVALACDIRLMSSTASIGLTETSLAIIPGAGGTVRLPQLVGLGRAKELIFTARRIDAKEACDIGLVEELCDPDTLLPRATDLATSIAKNGPLAVRAAKRSINAAITEPANAFKIERDAYASIIDSKDRLEGLTAFIEKRSPEYQGH